MKPFFSIIAPCCNVEPYLRECVESVLAQSFSGWELILGVEDSTDATADIAREYAARDPRIKPLHGPRSGSPSTPRNKGLEIAQGEYVIFLDGDDSISDGSLQRLHDAIAARPGADLYPCALVVKNELEDSKDVIKDNYAPDFAGELTGPEATRMVYTRSVMPCPMTQLTIYRRKFLDENNLRCVDGLRHEDNEFTPRALYLAKRVIPLHEKFYLYRLRQNSIMTAAKNMDRFIGDFSRVFKSLLAFHAKVSREEGFDRRISSLWGRQWIGWIYYHWFSPRAISKASRKRRLETLQAAFSDGFGDFDCIVKYSTKPRKVAAKFVKLFVRHPSMAWFAEAFFRFVYYPLTGVRDGIRGV